MKILLIEDDETKASSITNYITEEFVSIKVINRKKSWQSGLLEILDNMIYNVVLLDMSMPRYDAEVGDVNEEFEAFAGEELLNEMYRKEISANVCVITSFDFFGKNSERVDANTLDKRMKCKFKDNYKRMIYFSYSSSKWKDELKDFLKGVIVE